ncbi:hypothetical protein [Paenibacillus sp. UNC496MF]|uniref:hypothetical protein n=1 Tax=Paenibacillus sp. UNC496MF TaxID=1502753 RepID=UPI000B862D16|nr:hypothetical protein [Paenibacillus sp. UNC496MF]
MERLQRVSRDRSETYAAGSALGRFGSGFFRQYDPIEEFRRVKRRSDRGARRHGHEAAPEWARYKKIKA